MKNYVLFLSVWGLASLVTSKPANCQEYKLKQVTSMNNMKTESTIYVKGMRKRTEGGAVMGIGGNIVTIEQCDLKRTIRLNDKKKLYIITPFGTPGEDKGEINVPIPAKEENKVTKKGGVITTWYNITDTGERKKMYGFTARHVWTYQKMKPSPDACTMKDSMLIRTDGWYIDLPEFKCPQQYQGGNVYVPAVKPDCKDKYVSHSSGKGKLGFPLIETMIMVMGDGSMGEIKTTVETVELSTARLDTLLFTIPPGYRLASNEQELQDEVDINAMLKNVMNENNNQGNNVINSEKIPGRIRVGVFAPAGSDEVQAGLLQQKLIQTVNSNSMEGVPVSTDEEAKKLNCDYTLASNFTNIKAAGKVGGLIKAIAKKDPNAASTYTIQGNMILRAVADGSVKGEKSIEGKYEGRIDDAAAKALADGCEPLLQKLR